jgi:hypothetical protein
MRLITIRYQARRCAFTGAGSQIHQPRAKLGQFGLELVGSEKASLLECAQLRQAIEDVDVLRVLDNGEVARGHSTRVVAGRPFATGRTGGSGRAFGWCS